MEFIKKNIIGIALFFVILPIIIFAFGFLEIYIAIPFSTVILICYYKVLKTEIITENNVVFTKKNIIISSIIILIWLLFSGIGNFSYQNSDFEVRNAVLRDLVNYDWPVIFSVKDMTNAVNLPENLEMVGFVYYFAYWLPAALIGKLFGLIASNIALYIWTFILLMLTLYLINVFLKKNFWVILYFFIFFSGLDVLGYLGQASEFSIFEHLEWWAGLFQYSSNTTQLYWVFNQSVMAWLITSLILNVKNISSILFISSLIFVYSPFATFGMIPIAIYLIINKMLKEEKEKKEEKSFKKIILGFKNLLFAFETLNAILLLIIFGSFYLSSDGSAASYKGFIFKIWDYIPAWRIFTVYMFFCVIEIASYVILICFDYKDTKKDGLLYVVILELLLIPFYKMTYCNDFCMRASIVPLFILMMYFIKYVSNIKSKTLFDKALIIIVVVLSFITPMNEINRSVYNTITLSREEKIMESEVYSIGNPITEEGFLLCDEQFYNKDLENTFFSKYLLRK